MTQHDALDDLFDPRSIGIVGEVRNARSWSHQILNNLIDHQYPGEILPVAPGGGKILGHKIYQNVREIQSNTDLLLLCTPIDQAVKITEQVAGEGPSYVALLSSGQSASGEDEYLERLARVSENHGLRILGPDCAGIFSSTTRLNATALPSADGAEGNIAFVSQSGAYGDLLFSQLEQRGLNVGKYISLGSQVDLSHVDVISYLKDDTDTDVIALFVEEILNGPEFLRVAGETTLSKPIVSFLGSRTDSGLRASLGHSQREAPKFPVYSAAFEQSGVQLFNDTDEFFDAITVFAGLEQQFPMSDDIGVLSASSGPAVAACDAAEEMGLPITAFPDDLQDELRETLPDAARVDNPIQVPHSTDADQLRSLSDVLAESDDVNGLISLNIGYDESSFATPFVQNFQRELKPIVSFVSRCESVETTFRDHGVPTLASPERAARGMKFLCDYRNLIGDQKRKGLPDEEVFEQIQDGMRLCRETDPDDVEQLDELDSKSFLSDLDLPVVDEIVTESQQEAVKFARTTGLPVNVQVYQEGGQDDPELIYRDVDSIDSLETAYLSLRRRSSKSPILVRSAEGTGLHLLARAVRDKTFGIVITFGLGGIYSDVLSDESHRLAPIQKPEARSMIDQIQASDLLDGFRRYPSVDRDRVAEVLLRVSELLINDPELQEVEINPLFAREDQVHTLGASVRRIAGE